MFSENLFHFSESSIWSRCCWSAAWQSVLEPGNTSPSVPQFSPKKKMWFREFLSYLSKLYLVNSFIFLLSIPWIFWKKKDAYICICHMSHIQISLGFEQISEDIPKAMKKQQWLVVCLQPGFFSGNCCQATLDFLRDLEDSSQLSCKTPISVNPYSIQCEMASLESKKKHKGCSTESVLHVHIFKCCFQRFETYFSQLCQVATLTSISQCTSKIKKIQKIKRSKRSKV